jgi:hypothetical protein
MIEIQQVAQKSVAERRDRFRDYLNLKFTSGRNIKVIEVALRRGTADTTQCDIDVEDSRDKSCRQQCGPLDKVDDFKRCDVRCPPSEACTRVKRCLENF